MYIENILKKTYFGESHESTKKINNNHGRIKKEKVS